MLGRSSAFRTLTCFPTLSKTNVLVMTVQRAVIDVTLKDQQHAGRLNVDQTMSQIKLTERLPPPTYQMTISRIPRCIGLCLLFLGSIFNLEDGEGYHYQLRQTENASKARTKQQKRDRNSQIQSKGFRIVRYVHTGINTSQSLSAFRSPSAFKSPPAFQRTSTFQRLFFSDH
jgi:hypothetical protein